jgi:transcriptional regulator with XRE-family HTH domain
MVRGHQAPQHEEVQYMPDKIEDSVRARDHVSEKIDHLFHTVRREDGREYTYDDVERGTDGRVSRSYVWKLRHGRNRNPSLDVIEAMAEFFRVPPSYFFGEKLDSDPGAQEAAEVASLLQDPAARHVALKARGLSAPAIHAVGTLLDSLHLIENGRR